jgi:hypothetical protein
MCTFPNLRSEDKCKGCGANVPPGMYQPDKPAGVVSHGTSAYTPAPVQPTAAQVHVPQHHATTTTTTTNLSQQMNNMHVSNPSSGTMRVPVPNGMQPGQKIKVRSPDGKEVVKVIPPRHEWSTDEHGRSFF